MKIAICEPHSDDCWLNMGGYILTHPENEYLIITIAESPKNHNKSFVLRKFGNIKNICYSCKNIEKDYFIKFDKDGVRGEIEDIFNAKNKIGFEGLKEKIKQDTVGYDKVYGPMGLRDALHNLIARIEFDGYYREVPYFWNRNEWKGVKYKYNEYDLNDIEELKLDDDKFQYKWKIFDTVYQDQIGMMIWFRPFYKSIQIEQIYQKK